MRHALWRASSGLVVAGLAAAAAYAQAADWTGWLTVPDTHQNSLSIRYRQAGGPSANGDPEWIYQVRNRYGRPATCKIEFVVEQAEGTKRVTQTLLLLAPGEQERPEFRLVGRKIVRAFATEVNFGGAGPGPTPERPDVQQLRQAVFRKRQEVERLESARLESERNAARVRAAATARAPYTSYTGLTQIYDGRDVAAAEQAVRDSLRRADEARHALTNLERSLAAATGEQTRAATFVAAAQQAAAAGRWAEAEAAYREALRHDSNNALHLANLAVTLRNQGKLADAVTSFRQAVQLEPKNATYQNGFGRMLLEQSKPAEAEPAFREATRLAPGAPDGHYNLAVALASQNKAADAEAPAREAVRLDAGLAKHHFVLGAALLKQNKASAAEPALREAARLEANNADYHAHLSAALGRQNKWPEAEKALREAVRLAPGVARHHGNLGLALANEGKWSEAEAEYREAARLAPKDENFKRQMRQVREKQGKAPE